MTDPDLSKLDLQTLRSLFNSQQTEYSDGSAVVSPDAARPAAVLVPLFEKDSKVTTLLTRRRDDLAHHPGQISFPGGTPEPEDSDPVDTALREADEEIGLKPTAVDVVGRLSRVEIPVTGFIVTPFIGLIKNPLPELTVSPDEVSELITVSLEELYNGKTYREIDVRGARVKAPAYQSSNHTVWGATGRILDTLFKLIAKG